MNTITIKEAGEADSNQVLAVERAAFGSEEEAALVQDLLADASARPMVSLLAFDDDQAVGHILFTRAHIESDTSLAAAILAPLAVIPACQKQGIGGKLIQQGLTMLSQSGVGLVFVLGYPDYYAAHGFKPAGEQGLEAPFPIEAKNADAWMVQALKPNILGTIQGKVVCADQLNKPEYWRE